MWVVAIDNRFMLNDQIRIYHSLLDKCNYTTLYVRSITSIATQVFKSLNNLNYSFMNEIFNVKDTHTISEIQIMYFNQRLIRLLCQ